MGNEGKNGKVSLISKIAYGFGDVGCNFSWMFVSNFLMIFYTDVFGISMAAVSALMLFSRFWDAINDPIMGALMDALKPGKKRIKILKTFIFIMDLLYCYFQERYVFCRSQVHLIRLRYWYVLWDT